MILTGDFTVEQLTILAPHRDHELEIIKYATDGPIAMLTIECVPCKKMLIDLPKGGKA